MCANSTRFSRVRGKLSLRYPRVSGLQCNICTRRAYRITYFSSSNVKWSGTAKVLCFDSLLYLLAWNSASKSQVSQKKRVRQPSLVIADSNFVYWLSARPFLFFLFIFSLFSCCLAQGIALAILRTMKSTNAVIQHWSSELEHQVWACGGCKCTMRDNNESHAGSSVKNTACTLRSFPSRLEHALLIEGDVTSEHFTVLYGSIATDLDTVVH